MSSVSRASFNVGILAREIVVYVCLFVCMHIVYLYVCIYVWDIIYINFMGSKRVALEENLRFQNQLDDLKTSYSEMESK